MREDRIEVRKAITAGLLVIWGAIAFFTISVDEIASVNYNSSATDLTAMTIVICVGYA